MELADILQYPVTYTSPTYSEYRGERTYGRVTYFLANQYNLTKFRVVLEDGREIWRSSIDGAGAIHSMYDGCFCGSS